MSLAHVAQTVRQPAHMPVHPGQDPAEGPLVLNPAELRQLWQCYHELLEQHRSDVVEDEAFEDAHKLLVEQLMPLRQILRDREHLVVDPAAGFTW